jgi:hypothetical protein
MALCLNMYVVDYLATVVNYKHKMFIILATGRSERK